MPETQATTREDEPDDPLVELRHDVEFVDRKHERRVDDTIKPRLDALESDSDDARQERAELFQMVRDLQETVVELNQRVDDMVGLADDQETNPEKRLSDLRQILIRRAKARGESGTDDNYERDALWWEEVQDKFAELGHGDICRPVCYKAMYDLAKQPGFEEGTKVNNKGNEVTAIRVNLDELRAHASSSDPTTQEIGNAARNGQNPGDVTS